MPPGLHSGRSGTAVFRRARRWVPTLSHDTKLLMNTLIRFDDLKSKNPDQLPVSGFKVLINLRAATRHLHPD